MELEAPVKVGVTVGDEPAPAPVDGQQTPAPLIMIETGDTGVCAADGSGC